VTPAIGTAEDGGAPCRRFRGIVHGRRLRPTPVESTLRGQDRRAPPPGRPGRRRSIVVARLEGRCLANPPRLPSETRNSELGIRIRMAEERPRLRRGAPARCSSRSDRPAVASSTWSAATDAGEASVDALGSRARGQDGRAPPPRRRRSMSRRNQPRLGRRAGASRGSRHGAARRLLRATTRLSAPPPSPQIQRRPRHAAQLRRPRAYSTMVAPARRFVFVFMTSPFRVALSLFGLRRGSCG
jgi:hypothetical protein